MLLTAVTQVCCEPGDTDHHLTAPLYILEEERKPRAGWSKETDDEYCRRKDRYYEMLVVDLEQKKKEKAKVRELMVIGQSAGSNSVGDIH